MNGLVKILQYQGVPIGIQKGQSQNGDKMDASFVVEIVPDPKNAPPNLVVEFVIVNARLDSITRPVKLDTPIPAKPQYRRGACPVGKNDSQVKFSAVFTRTDPAKEAYVAMCVSGGGKPHLPPGYTLPAPALHAEIGWT